MISIGRMAEKYGMLPSQVEQHATTYDLMISDVLATYDRYIQSKQTGKTDISVYQYTEEELKAMMKKAQKHE
jgi:hypothetical protein